MNWQIRWRCGMNLRETEDIELIGYGQGCGGWLVTRDNKGEFQLAHLTC